MIIHQGDKAIESEKECSYPNLEESKERFLGEGKQIKEGLQALKNQFEESHRFDITPLAIKLT